MDERLAQSLERNSSLFHPVVPFEPGDPLLLMDFTDRNTALRDDVLSDTQAFSAYVNSELARYQCRYGIGGYDEHRTIYKRSVLFGEGNEKPRRLHLGLDIWGPPNTKVFAPFDGIVHSFAFNNGYGDYGTTIILSHRLETKVFFTLYGHLSLGSIANLQEGDSIRKGEVFAAFGTPADNGQWPPHLHFQLIENIGASKGDYPGVCAFDEKEKFLSNSPDPELMLRMKEKGRTVQQEFDR